MLALLVLLGALEVHEWGVITTSNGEFTGLPGTFTASAIDDPAAMEDRAPVLYFHGDPCTLSLRISFPSMGYATETVPVPDQGGINSNYATWANLELTASTGSPEEYGWAEETASGIPAPLWRNVDALDILRNGFRDRFVYYECVPGSPGELPFIISSGSVAMRVEYGDIPCLVLTSNSAGPMYGVFTLEEIQRSIPKGLRFMGEPEELRREVYRWSEGILEEDEFDAFWNTWESSFLADCSSGVTVLYPVPQEVLDGIARIEIIPDNGQPVSISRFVVAEMPYREW